MHALGTDISELRHFKKLGELKTGICPSLPIAGFLTALYCMPTYAGWTRLLKSEYLQWLFGIQRSFFPLQIKNNNSYWNSVAVRVEFLSGFRPTVPWIRRDSGATRRDQSRGLTLTWPAGWPLPEKCTLHKGISVRTSPGMSQWLVHMCEWEQGRILPIMLSG